MSRRDLLRLGLLGGAILLGGAELIDQTVASADPTDANTEPSVDPQLGLLAQYESGEGVAPEMMKFIGFPESRRDGVDLANELASDLLQWSEAGVTPIIIMEPTFNDGQDLMDLVEFGNGRYDKALASFFDTLQESVLTPEQMGIWVPFPEPNTDSWANNNTDPTLFVANASSVATMINERFTGVPVSVMLDSQTLVSGSNGDYTMDPNALTPYLQFEPGLISSFGFQGFSWDNEDGPSTYLNAQTAITAAQELGVSDVWFNTGTFSIVNNPNGEGIITADDNRRESLLSDVLSQAYAVQQAGLTVEFINIFGQNVYDPNNTGTADYQYSTPEDLAVLTNFVNLAKWLNIPVTIFDATS